jgi:hypothetical protein
MSDLPKYAKKRLCKWCAKGGTAPLIQVRPDGVFHRYSFWYFGTKRKTPWTFCGYEVSDE